MHLKTADIDASRVGNAFEGTSCDTLYEGHLHFLVHAQASFSLGRACKGYVQEIEAAGAALRGEWLRFGDGRMLNQCLGGGVQQSPRR